MGKKLLLFGCCLLACIFGINALKIAVFSPKLAYSHMRFMGRLADTLTEAGHDVTLIQPIQNLMVRGSGCVKTKIYPIEMKKETLEQTNFLQFEKDVSKLVWEETWNPFQLKHGAESFKPLLEAFCADLMSNKTMLEDLRQQNFDIGITELFDHSAFPIFYTIGLKTIVGAHSTTLMDGTAYATAVPILPSFIPTFVATTGDSTSLWNRIKNLGQTYEGMQASYIFSGPTAAYMKKHMPDAPPLWDMIADLPLIFVNTVPVLDYPRPSLQHIIDVGGLSMEKSKPLNKEWSDIMDLRPNTVLFSLGSIFPPSSMSLAMKTSIINVFKRMPNTTFIWKYEPNLDKELFENTPNIIRTSWMPQNDILGDSRLTLFITHGGAGSLQESAFNGIPVLMVPLFADQHRNAYVAESRGYAIRLDKHDFSDEKKFEHALREIINNPSYKQSAQRIQRQIKLLPMSPQEKVIRYIHLFEHPEDFPDFRSKGRHLSLVQYYNLDIFLLVILSLVIIIYVLISFLKNLFKIEIKEKKN